MLDVVRLVQQVKRDSFSSKLKNYFTKKPSDLILSEHKILSIGEERPDESEIGESPEKTITITEPSVTIPEGKQEITITDEEWLDE